MGEKGIAFVIPHRSVITFYITIKQLHTHLALNGFGSTSVYPKWRQ